MSYKKMMKDYREKNNLSTAQFADMVGISQSSVSLIENGKRKPSVKILDKLAKFFNVSMESLVEEESNNNLLDERLSPVTRTFEGQLHDCRITATVKVEFSEDVSTLTKDQYYGKREFYDLARYIVLDVLEETIEINEEEFYNKVTKRLVSDMEDKFKSLVQTMRTLKK